jgi:hypothetical protein
MSDLPVALIEASAETGLDCGTLCSKTWLTEQLKAMGNGDQHLLSCIGDLSNHQLLTLRDRIAFQLLKDAARAPAPGYATMGEYCEVHARARKQSMEGSGL